MAKVNQNVDSYVLWVFFVRLSVCLFLRFNKTQHCGDVFNLVGLVVFEGTAWILQQAQYAKQHITVYVSVSDSDEGTDTQFCVKD